jgi:uncharacterized protein GlcG (DUF336 family)/mannose-6-phosphate isomerase-like protein (cupin superfamily)
MIRRIAAIALLAAPLLPSPATAADSVSSRNLSLEGARHIVEAARAHARERGAPGAAIAVVDGGGRPILVERLDGTFPAGFDVSIGKARTAVAFGRPTRFLEETINGGREAMLALPAITAFTPLLGGVPVMIDGQVAGAVGVSGASSAQQDEEIAIAGATALGEARVSPAVQRVDAAEVRAAFQRGETGATLVEHGRFRVNASRRDRPGEAELHEHETDIFYVLEGRANVVFGGELLAPRIEGSGELRGDGIRGGDSLQLGPGDVLTIPNGVPHWFREVRAPFRYFVVKSLTGG